MLCVSNVYKSLYKILNGNFKTVNEKYTIGLNFSKKDVLDRIKKYIDLEKDNKISSAENKERKKKNPNEDKIKEAKDKAEKEAKDAMEEVKLLVDKMYKAWEDEFKSDPAKIPFRFSDDDKEARQIRIARYYKDLSLVDGLTKDDKYNIGPVTFKYGNGNLPLQVSDDESYSKYNGKELTPQGLGVTGKFNLTSLVGAISKGLKESKYATPSLSDALIYLCNQIKNDSHEQIDFNQLIIAGANKARPGDDSIKTLKYALPSNVNLVELKTALGAISKDFGELLGGIYMLKFIKDSKTVSYSNDYSEKLIDYKIQTDNDEIGVSAKEYSGGHHPSAKIFFDKLENFVLKGEKVGDLTFKDLIKKHYVTKGAKDYEIKEFFELFTKSKNESTKKQWLMVIDKYAGNLKCAKDFCKLFMGSGKNFIDLIKEFSESSLEKNFSARFNEICDDDNSFKELKKLYNEIKSECKSNPATKIDSAEQAKKLTPDNKIGAFIYPLEVYAINKINSMFGVANQSTGVDIISAFARLAFSHRQIYLGISITAGKNITMKLKFALMNKAKWEISKAGVTAGDPFKERIAMHIIL